MTEEKKCLSFIGVQSPLNGKIHIWDFPSGRLTMDLTHFNSYGSDQLDKLEEEYLGVIEAVKNDTVIVIDREMEWAKYESKKARQKHNRPKPVKRSPKHQKFPKQRVRRR